jgi:hypothetical protein
MGSTATLVTTATIIPSMPNGWDPVAGFPASPQRSLLDEGCRSLGSIDLSVEVGCDLRPVPAQQFASRRTSLPCLLRFALVSFETLQ